MAQLLPGFALAFGCDSAGVYHDNIRYFLYGGTRYVHAKVPRAGQARAYGLGIHLIHLASKGNERDSQRLHLRNRKCISLYLIFDQKASKKKYAV